MSRNGTCNRIPAEIAMPPKVAPFKWPENPVSWLEECTVAQDRQGHWTITIGRNGSGGHSLTLRQANSVRAALNELESRLAGF